MSDPTRRAWNGRFIKTKADYLVYESELVGEHQYLWLSIQHVGLTLPGHNDAGYAVQHGSETATYLLAVTIVASVNRWESYNSGDYAAYIGIGSPQTRTDPERVAHIATHGNKIEGALAEHLFRKTLDKKFGKGVIKYRA